MGCQIRRAESGLPQDFRTEGGGRGRGLFIFFARANWGPTVGRLRPPPLTIVVWRRR